jgi:hypothetical protein
MSDVVTEVTDHAARARALLTSMFKGRRYIEGVLTAFVGKDKEAGLQEVEHATHLFLARMEQWQDTSVITDPLEDAIRDYVLYLVGRIVGIDREGRDVAHFVAALQLQIIINRSDGTNPNVIEILDLATQESGDYELYDYYPAGFVALLSDAPEYFRAFASRATSIKPIGVEADIKYTGLPLDGLVRYASSHGATIRAKGFASDHGGALTAAFPHVEIS